MVECVKSGNVISKRHLTLVLFINIIKNTTGQYNVISQIFEQEYFSFMRMTDYPFKINGALFLWHVHHFVNMGCRSDTLATATNTRFFLKMISNLIDKICYYVSHMNESSLSDRKHYRF